jgi:hypothetical protein
MMAEKIICHACGKEITNGFPVMHRGMPYHVICKFEEPPSLHIPFQLFEEVIEKTVCEVCKKVILDDVCIRYLKQTYHIQCMINRMEKEKKKMEKEKKKKMAGSLS